jgi:hypothetical protein
MAGIEIARRLLLSLRHHPGRIRAAWHAPRAEQLALLIVFGLAGPAIIDLPANPHVLVMDLATGPRLFSGNPAFVRGHGSSFRRFGWALGSLP